MVVLVTGGAGYIGSHVVLRLGEVGSQAIVLDDLSSGFRGAVPQSVPLIVGQIQDATLIRRVIRDYGVKAVMHFAGSVIVEESVHNPTKYYLNNTCGTLSLLDACLAAGVDKLIFSSTAAVYGNVSDAPVAEESPKNPVSPYGWSKLMSEQMIQSLAAAYGLKYVILRYFNVAGADPELRSGIRAKNATHLIKVACEAATGARAYLPIFGGDYPTRDGTCIRDFIHVSDLADIHIAALEHLFADGGGGIFNCGYGAGFTVNEVVQAFCRELHAPLPTKVEGRRLGDLTSVVADVSLARKTFRWEPRFNSIDTIVQTALRWEKKVMAGSSGPAPS